MNVSNGNSDDRRTEETASYNNTGRNNGNGRNGANDVREGDNAADARKGSLAGKTGVIPSTFGGENTSTRTFEESQGKDFNEGFDSTEGVPLARDGDGSDQRDRDEKDNYSDSSSAREAARVDLAGRGDRVGDKGAPKSLSATVGSADHANQDTHGNDQHATPLNRDDTVDTGYFPKVW
jgi:hypothetical protein